MSSMGAGVCMGKTSFVCASGCQFGDVRFALFPMHRNQLIALNSGDDPVGMGEYRAKLASILDWLSDAGWEADDADLACPEEEHFQDRYLTVEASLIAAGWLYISETIFQVVISHITAVAECAGGKIKFHQPLPQSDIFWIIPDFQ